MARHDAGVFIAMDEATPDHNLMDTEICHECDLKVEIPPLGINQKALCPRCGYLLSANRANSLARIQALAITSLIFLFISLAFDFISFKSSGLENKVKMLDSLDILMDSGYIALAIIKLVTVFIIPAFVLCALIYLLVFIRNGRYPWQGDRLMNMILLLIPWNMAEIFLVGTLVSLIKIVSLADIILGPSFFAFILFSIAMTATLLHIDKRQLSLALAATRAKGVADTGATVESPHQAINPSLSIQRTWALIITSIMLFIPANTLPIMNTRLLGQDDPSTIIGGVLLLWHHGSYPIAMVIFIASILVPIAKILVLIWLNYSVQTNSMSLEQQRIVLYRIAEFIGRWSMIDIFVVIVLASLVQLGNTMSIVPGAATFAFTGVVVVTMLAAMSFEPRLIYNDKSAYEHRTTS
ncbi:paraquat-inducible protein A [Shewanella corallii]|uniref:Paraquat-inducible protein A n=1 Tax=Shewanella corallii TaxID=560080 RepID=A0ABT0N8E5_9GAMM|nr:paraquat-inducible protein A [Shewanella corallii]MCL2914723.1 paraquat-inducible protein A [Shewanella corallii]